MALTLGVGLGPHSVEDYGVRIFDGGLLGCDLDDVEVRLSGVVGPATKGCAHWQSAWAHGIDSIRPDVVGLLIGRWEVSDHLFDGHWVHVGDPAWDDHLVGELNQAVDILSSRGAKVVLFTMPYVDPPTEAADGTPFPENDPTRVVAFNSLLAEVGRQRPGVVTVIDLNKLLDPAGHYQSVIDGVTVRWPDGVHISQPGGLLLQPHVLPEVGRLGLAARAAGAGAPAGTGTPAGGDSGGRWGTVSDDGTTGTVGSEQRTMTEDHAHGPGLTDRPSATGKARISALDGLRALALLIIMGYHFGVGWLQGGFFSLDIFYVLSGYLITGLLLSEYARKGRIVLSAFWLRRARRLLPALLIVLVAVTVMVRFAEPAGLYPDFRMSALSALFYFSNWWQIAASSNYFVATGAVSPLTHTWSLAVEEQFYLVWPLVTLAVLHLSRTIARGVRALLVVSVAGAIASALEMALSYSPTANTTRLYFGTDTHAQSILIGATLACALTMVQQRRGNQGMAPVATTKAARWALVALGLAGLAGTLTLTYSLQGLDRLRLPGRVHPVGPVGGGHHHRGGVRAHRPPGPGAVPPGAGVDRDRLLRGLPVALPGLRLLRHRPHRADRHRAAGRPLRRHLRPGRGQLLPGGAPGHGRTVLAVGQGHRPGHRTDGRHGGGGAGGDGGGGPGVGACRRLDAQRRTEVTDRGRGLHHQADHVHVARRLHRRDVGSRPPVQRACRGSVSRSSTARSWGVTSTTCTPSSVG